MNQIKPEYYIVDTEKGESWRCFPVKSTGTSQQRSRNRKKIEAFLRYMKDKKQKVGWWTFGVSWGPGKDEYGRDGYERFQKAIDHFLRTIHGLYVYGIEVGEKGGKLHCHMLMERFKHIDEFKRDWEGSTGMKNVNVDCCVLPGKKRLEDGTYRPFENDEEVSYYISKYCAKAQEKLKGVRTFRSSKGLTREISSFFEKEGFTFFLSKEYSEQNDSKVCSRNDSSNLSANQRKV